MPVFIDNKNTPIVFIHIPKTAGTSIKAMLKADVEMLFNYEFKKDLPCPPQHFHQELLQCLGVLSAWHIQFAVIRNPIKRFISEYTYRQKVDPKFKYMNITAFAQFIFKIYKYNPYILSNHIRPQHEFIGPKTKVYRLEDGLDTLFEDYPDYFKPACEQAGFKNKSSSNALPIDPKVLSAIADFYKSDLSLFQYSTDCVTTKKETPFKYAISILFGNCMFYLYRLLNKKQ